MLAVSITGGEEALEDVVVDGLVEVEGLRELNRREVDVSFLCKSQIRMKLM